MVVELETKLTTIKESMNKLREDKKRCEFALENSEKLCKRYEDAMLEGVEADALYKNVMELYSKVTNDRNASAKELLEDVLNNALEQVPLASKYEAHLFEPATTKAVKDLYIRLLDLSSNNERGLLTGSGTMVGQMMSFLMSAIVLKFSGKRKLMILDEVFTGFEDEDAIVTFGELLVALAKNEGFQFIFIEHKHELNKVEGIVEYNFIKPSYEQGLVLASSQIVKGITTETETETETDTKNGGVEDRN
jgi:DNA repair exonuclease SbcCD ATPase subunit